MPRLRLALCAALALLACPADGSAAPRHVVARTWASAATWADAMPQEPAAARANTMLQERPAARANDGAQPCPALTTPSSPLTITAPADNLVVSSTVPLAVAPPTDATASVNVCGSYYFWNAFGQLTYQQNSLVTTLSGADAWRSSWDVSTLPSQSNVTLSFIANDPSGAQSLIGMRQGLVFDLDHTAPTSWAAVGAPQYTALDGTLYVAATTPISLAAADPPLDDGSPGSGVTASYRVDGGTARQASAPFTLGMIGDGLHTVTYWATDGVGNVEPAHTLPLSLDNTPPAITPLISGLFNPDGSAYAPVTVAFTATDAGSGLRSMSYDVEPSCADGESYPQPYTPGQSIVIAATRCLIVTALDWLGNLVTNTFSITVALPTPSPTAQPGSLTAPPDTPTPAVPTVTPTPTRTPRPAATPTDTRTPHPTPMPTATRTPRPTPTWPAIDGPPILKRTAPHGRRAAVAIRGTPAAYALPVHLHVLPTAIPGRGRSTRGGRPHRSTQARRSAPVRHRARHAASRAGGPAAEATRQDTAAVGWVPTEWEGGYTPLRWHVSAHLLP